VWLVQAYVVPGLLRAPALGGLPYRSLYLGHEQRGFVAAARVRGLEPIVSLPIGAVTAREASCQRDSYRRAGPESEPAVGTVAVDMYVFSAELWQYAGPSAWYFVSLPPDVADDIRARFGAQAAGFGSIKVEAAVRSTQWTTSLFPDKTRGTYLLPVKKSVRVAENLEAGDVATVSLRI
jgi:hypothetical protein